MPKKLFEVGNPGGPGRPKKKTEERAFNILSTKMDDDTIAQVFDTMIRKAVNGDYRQTELLLAYLMGKPVQRVETSSDNPMAEKFEEWKRARLEAMQQFLMEQAQVPAVRVVEEVVVDTEIANTDE